jgi:hypothetical protein
LRTAVAREGILDKEATSYDDILDAFRLCVRGFEQVQTDNPVGTETWTDEQVASVQEAEKEEEFLQEEYQQLEKPKWTSYKTIGIGY